MEREEAEALVPKMLERNDGACESVTAFFRSSREYGCGHSCRREERASEARAASEAEVGERSIFEAVTGRRLSRRARPGRVKGYMTWEEKTRKHRTTRINFAIYNFPFPTVSMSFPLYETMH